MTNRYLRNLIVWAVILAVAFPFALQLWRRTPRELLDYSDFITQIQSGQVTEVQIGDGKVDGRLKNGQQFTTYVPQSDTSYIELLKAKSVPIRVEPRSPSSLWPSLLSTLLPILLLVGLWMLMMRQARSGGNLGSWLWKKLARERTIIAAPTLSPPRGFSHGILVKGGQLLFIAGQDASDVEGKVVAPGDLVRQFEQALRNLSAVVEAAGGTLQDVVKLNVFVRDRGAYVTNLKPIGEIFRRYFGGHYPAMALFEVSGFFRDDALIEMEGIAVLEHPRTDAPAASVGP
ncbi:MAG: ATP-dependent metallopeptidase FtsH/Yme1/Tma family protein [bacterium]